jgi:hypothetical protein
MGKINLGRVAFNHRGEYSRTETYKKLDTVSEGGSTYVSIVENNIGHNVKDTNYWSPVAKGCYTLWLDQGNSGTESEFLKSLKGPDGRVRKISHGTSDTTFRLSPQEYHVWDEVETLTLTLDTDNLGDLLPEYMFQFTSPANKATVLTISGVRWINNYIPTIQPGKTYQASILNGIIVMEGA